MKRIVDILLSFILIIFFLPLIAIIALCVKLTSSGPVIHWSKRVGKKGTIFLMPKFRTMFVKAPVVATHLLVNSREYLTPIGAFMRKYSLDELPQLWSIFIGEMSFVGPRPALFNQYDLIALRKQFGVDKLAPGLTGWAQVNGRDELSILAKVNLDCEYLNRQTFFFDLRILFLTFFRVARAAGVSH
jgi:O-antigen biosynthesis protein WbqP